jgi:hypothetical protein
MSRIFYLGQIFNGIDILTAVMFFLGIIAFVCFGIWYVLMVSEGYEKGDNEIEAPKKAIKWSLIAIVIGIVVNTLVPNRTTWYLMKGGDAVEKVATSKEVSETAEKTLKLVNQYLDTKLNKNKEEE